MVVHELDEGVLEGLDPGEAEGGLDDFLPDGAGLGDVPVIESVLFGAGGEGLAEGGVGEERGESFGP